MVMVSISVTLASVYTNLSQTNEKLAPVLPTFSVSIQKNRIRYAWHDRQEMANLENLEWRKRTHGIALLEARKRTGSCRVARTAPIAFQSGTTVNSFVTRIFLYCEVARRFVFSAFLTHV